MAGIVPGLLAIGCLLVMNRIISGRRGYGGQAENYTKEEKRHIIIEPFLAYDASPCPGEAYSWVL